MDHIYGSLDKFLVEIPEIYRHSESLNRTRMHMSATRPRMESKRSCFNSPPKALCNVKAKSFSTGRYRSSFIKKTRTDNLSILPLSDNDKIRNGLMYELFSLSKTDILLRSMRINIKEEEQKIAEAKIDLQSMDAVKNSIKKYEGVLQNIKNQSLKALVFSPKTAMSKLLTYRQKSWIRKHKMMKYPDKIEY